MTDPIKAAVKLTPTQQRALEVLLVGGTDQQAAEASGLHKNTIYKLRHTNAAFTGALHAARADLLRRTMSRLHAATTVAVKALEDVAKDVRNPSARVAAARAIIEFSQKAIEMEELEVRLTTLEERLAAEKETMR